MSPFQRNGFPNMITIILMNILVYRKLPNKTAPTHIKTCICSIFIKRCVEFLANIIHSCILFTTIRFHGLIFSFITKRIELNTTCNYDERVSLVFGGDCHIYVCEKEVCVPVVNSSRNYQ